MGKDLYYKLNNGTWLERYKVEDAFYLDYGYYPIKGNESEFLIWLNDKLGKTIVEVRKGNDPYLVDALIKAKQRVLAIKVLHRQWGFSFTKAREIVDATEAKIEMQIAFY